MLKKETTFVIGAGGSENFEFPLGDELRKNIASLLLAHGDGVTLNFNDRPLNGLLQDLARMEAGQDWVARFQAYRRAASIIREGLPFTRSIDSFLDGLPDEPDVVFLGKLSIAIVILRKEASSALHVTTPSNIMGEQFRAKKMATLMDSWQASLCQILYEGHNRETIDTIFDRVSFIIFNYDRCIEEFLTISLMRRFAVDRRRALEVVAGCRIVHPYGQVGEFFPDKPDHVSFGEAKETDLISVSRNIKTFTESMHAETSERVKTCISKAETIVFMGFGWLPQNLELLRAAGRTTVASRVFATTMKMPQGELDVVADQIDRILLRAGYTSRDNLVSRPQAKFVNELGNCKDLMNNCWLQLTND